MLKVAMRCVLVFAVVQIVSGQNEVTATKDTDVRAKAAVDALSSSYHGGRSGSLDVRQLSRPDARPKYEYIHALLLDGSDKNLVAPESAAPLASSQGGSVGATGFDGSGITWNIPENAAPVYSGPWRITLSPWGARGTGGGGPESYSTPKLKGKSKIAPKAPLSQQASGQRVQRAHGPRRTVPRTAPQNGHAGGHR